MDPPDPALSVPDLRAPSVVGAARMGALSLLFMHAVLFPVNVAASILLYKLLGHADVGINAGACAVLTFAGMVGDLGLGASLVRKPEEPSLRELRAVFTAQLALGLLLVAGVGVLAGPAVRASHAEPEAAWFVRGMGATLLLALAGSTGNVLLQRRLRFRAFTRVAIAAHVAEKVLVVAAAASGAGFWSFLIAGLGSNTVRLVAVFLAAPWRVGLAWDRAILLRHVQFGGLYQLCGLATFFRDSLAPLLGGPMYGPDAVGLLDFAWKLPFLASYAFVSVAGLVGFPAMSRLQGRRDELSRLATNLLRFLAVTCCFALAALAALAPEAIRVLFGTRGDPGKWVPAAPAACAYCVRVLEGLLATVLLPLLLASGRARKAFLFLACWAALDALAAFAGAEAFGWRGIAYGYAAADMLPALWILREARSLCDPDVRRAFLGPLLAGVVVGGALFVVKRFVPVALVPIVALAVAGAVAYAGLLLVVEGERLKAEVRQVLATARERWRTGR